MPLILAIEPDRRQANQLNAMVRGKLRAELVLAESAERALAALGDRIPDLILTSALLAPNDETLLGERLRKLDGVAAHVQTLTIPMLAIGKRADSGAGAGGVLGALRRVRTRSAAPDGCDPAVFAAQCQEYLERAEAERVAYSPPAAADGAPHAEPAQPIEPAAAVVPDDALIKAFEEPLSPIVGQPLVAQPIVTAPAPHVAPEVVERIEPIVVDGSAAAATVQEALARLELAQLQEFIVDESFDDVDLSTMLDERDASSVAPPSHAEVAEPDVYEITAMDAEPEAVAAAPIAEPAPVRPPAMSVDVKPAPERPAAENPWPEIEAAASEEAAAATATPASRPRQSFSARAHARPKPVQDEWGFFDPDQCGFAALLAKLDEIVDKGDQPPTRRRRA